MKIAVMTWFHYDNYGTVLQAAALRKVLKEFGHEVDIINYFPGDHVLTLPEKNTRSRFMKKAVKVGRAQAAKRDPVITTQISGEAFDHYREENLTLTAFCSTLSDLERLQDSYDCFVCGSDRIWLPDNFDPRFFLDFVEDPHRMIAYAPSVLQSGYTDPYILDQMKELIGRFLYQSVREESGRKYLGEVFGEETRELADPTMLVDLEDWGSQLQLPGGENERYLLACLQGENRFYWDAINRLADRLGLQVRIVPIHESDLRKEGVLTEPIGPVDYISLIRNADYICTDSYHGLVLSLVFNKEFCCFERYTRREELSLNERVSHILNSVGLQNRLYSSDAALEGYLTPIDYIPVNYKIDALKLRSREFLRQSLKEIEDYVREMTYEKRHILDGYTLCSGCGACTLACPSGAVSIVCGADGFLRAQVEEELCTHCEACREVCPFQGVPGGIPAAGGRLLSYQDEEKIVREKASAGGLSTRLALLLREKGYAVMGCVFDTQAQCARHILVTPENEEELIEGLSGSKYLQSEFASALRLLKDYEGPAAIFAAPCQIAGARRQFAGRDNILYIEIRCSGVPSLHLYDKYKKSFRGRSKMNDETFALAVRYRQSPAKGRFVYVSDGNNERVISKKKDLFSRFMDSGIAFSPACYECRWRETSQADIRIGDFRDDMPGSAETEESACIVLTQAGQNLINDLMIEGYWEGLHKRDMAQYLTKTPASNPPKPAFYRELMERLEDEKTSISKLANDYVKPLEV